jgi:DegV family protein with EDD domain
MLKIVADTTCGLPLDLARERNIIMIPQIVIFGEESYRDDTEIDIETFLARLTTSPQLPKTAAPPPTLYHPVFQDAQDKGETVLVIAPSAQVSGTVRSAQTAAADFPSLNVHIVDTRTLAGNAASLVLLAAQWRDEGAEAKSVIPRLEIMIANQRTYFVVDTLEYLKRGGRIGGAKALLGELLQVKPILQVRDGQVQPFDQERTKKRALARLMSIVTEEIGDPTKAYLSVMHIGAEEQARELAASLAEKLGIPTPPVYNLPAAIGVHAGPGTLAVGFFVLD